MDGQTEHELVFELISEISHVEQFFDLTICRLRLRYLCADEKEGQFELIFDQVSDLSSVGRHEPDENALVVERTGLFYLVSTPGRVYSFRSPLNPVLRHLVEV